MSADRAILLAPAPASDGPVCGPALSPAIAASNAWSHASVAVAVLALLVLQLDTASAIAGVWMRSSTFAHGILVPPIAAWLIWRRRAYLAGLARQPSPLALIPLAAFGALCLLATIANVHVLQQYSLVAMLIATVVAIMGLGYAREIAFPLAYLLLAVPFGEILVPPLIEFTSRFTVLLLQLLGIPVFREHNSLTLPTGNWSVVDACSGLRYLISSVALGTLYAYLTYRSLVRRLVFIGIALVLPIVANGLRACMIVLIGHWSNMTLAVGIDHLIYGWIFFGIVSSMLFWCGARWRQPQWQQAPSVNARRLHVGTASPASFIGMAAACITLIGFWQVVATHILQSPAPELHPEARLSLAAPPAPWRMAPLASADWRALHAGQPQRVAGNYSDGQRLVSLQLTWYRHQVKGSELLAPVRRIAIPGLPQWMETGASEQGIAIGRRHITVRQSIETADGIKLLVWRWYRQAGVDTSSPQLLKLMLARSKLLGGDDGGAEIVVACAYDEQTAPAAAAMQELLSAMLPNIDRGLQDVASR